MEKCTEIWSIWAFAISVLSLAINIIKVIYDTYAHQATFVPKYYYDFEKIIKAKGMSVVKLKLKLERSKIPYYINSIELLNSKTPIVSYSIGNFDCDENRMEFKKNKLINIYHLIQTPPISKTVSNKKEIELTITVPMILKENRSVRIGFGYDKHPHNSFVSIRLPPEFGSIE